MASNQDAAVIDLTGNPIAEPFESSSSSSASGSLDTSIDLDLSVSEDLNPNKIRRSLPMKMKSYDPAQCTDILDNMYEIYYDQEVRNQYITAWINPQHIIKHILSPLRWRPLGQVRRAAVHGQAGRFE